MNETITVFTRGTIVLPEAARDDIDLVVVGHRIHAIIDRDSERQHWLDQGARVVDLHGGYLIPGLIDVHSDYIEFMASPRPTSLMDFGLALRETERQLVGHGITTMFHSLAFHVDNEFETKAIRDPANTVRFIELIQRARKGDHLIRHRFHARFELDSLSRVDELRQYMDEGAVDMLSFMDHTPGQGQYRDLEMYRKTVKAYAGMTDQAEIDQYIAKSQAKPRLDIAAMEELIAMAHAKNIAVASHDDDTVEKLELNQQLGLDISEFPITIAVAKAARAKGMLTVAGAPNVLLGGSHSGNLSAAEAVQEGAIDALCSDYYPASMVHAPFILHQHHGMPLHQAINLVTLGPAKVGKMDHLVGSLQVDKEADLLVIQKEDGYPVVTRAYAAGALRFKVNYGADHG